MAPDSVLIGETEARALSCSPLAQLLWVGFLGYEPLLTEWEPQGEKGMGWGRTESEASLAYIIFLAQRFIP